MLVIRIPNGHNLLRQLPVTGREFFDFFIVVQHDLGNPPRPLGNTPRLSLTFSAAYLPQYQLRESVFQRRATTWAFMHGGILVREIYRPVLPGDYKRHCFHTQLIVGETFTKQWWTKLTDSGEQFKYHFEDRPTANAVSQRVLVAST